MPTPLKFAPMDQSDIDECKLAISEGPNTSAWDFFAISCQLLDEVVRLRTMLPTDIKQRLSISAKVLEDLEDKDQDLLDSFLAAHEGKPCRIIIEVTG